MRYILFDKRLVITYHNLENIMNRSFERLKNCGFDFEKAPAIVSDELQKEMFYCGQGSFINEPIKILQIMLEAQDTIGYVSPNQSAYVRSVKIKRSKKCQKMK